MQSIALAPCILCCSHRGMQLDREPHVACAVRCFWTLVRAMAISRLQLRPGVTERLLLSCPTSRWRPLRQALPTMASRTRSPSTRCRHHLFSVCLIFSTRAYLCDEEIIYILGKNTACLKRPVQHVAVTLNRLEWGNVRDLHKKLRLKCVSLVKRSKVPKPSKEDDSESPR